MRPRSPRPQREVVEREIRGHANKTAATTGFPGRRQIAGSAASAVAHAPSARQGRVVGQRSRISGILTDRRILLGRALDLERHDTGLLGAGDDLTGHLHRALDRLRQSAPCRDRSDCEYLAARATPRSERNRSRRAPRGSPCNEDSVQHNSPATVTGMPARVDCSPQTRPTLPPRSATVDSIRRESGRAAGRT